MLSATNRVAWSIGSGGALVLKPLVKVVSLLAVALMVVLMTTAISPQSAQAASLRERLAERRASQAQPREPMSDPDQDISPDDPEPIAPVAQPAGMRVMKDVAYGSDKRQRFDIYAPAQVKGAPVIFMVHGGAWAFGDKAARSVVSSKVARWVPAGYVFMSVNYRMVPKAMPVEQAQDVARALAAAQHMAASVGADPAKFILMGHSAGAHLVALLAAEPALASEQGAAPWLGAVLLDSGALDVPQIMKARHFRFYDRAFGKDLAYWQAASPQHRLAMAAAPLLAVCSSRRSTSCPQAHAFADKANSLGGEATVLEQDLSHGDINKLLGEPGAYTDAVNGFFSRTRR